MPAPKVLPQYDIAMFAQKHGISAAKAKDILDSAGDSRETADLIAKRAKPFPAGNSLAAGDSRLEGPDHRRIGDPAGLVSQSRGGTAPASDAAPAPAHELCTSSTGAASSNGPILSSRSPDPAMTASRPRAVACASAMLSTPSSAVGAPPGEDALDPERHPRRFRRLGEVRDRSMARCSVEPSPSASASSRSSSGTSSVHPPGWPQSPRPPAPAARIAAISRSMASISVGP